MKANPAVLALAVLFLSAVTGCDTGDSSFGEPTTPEPTAGTGGGGSGGGGSGGADAGPPTPGGGYYVSGNQILRADGTPHHFHGVSRPSLEWSQSGENLNQGDYNNMASWGANVVRIPVNQAFYLRAAGYPETVDSNVQMAKNAGLDVIIDLHWSDRGTTDPTGAQQEMADQNSLTFWTQVATRYKADGRVLFELYNEPHDVPLNIWRNGGQGPGFVVAGMQQLYDAVRATGANNIVIVGGLDYAYNLSGLLTHALDGVNIAYATHPYDYSNKLQANWENDWGRFAATYPIMVTEFGITAQGVSAGSCAATQYYSDVINYANQKGAHWVGWAWYPKDCVFPSLIADWAGNPTAAGNVVKQALAAFPR